MSGAMANFFSSPFFVPEPDNWHLLPGAPKEVRDEFNAMLRNDLKYGHIDKEYYESHLAKEEQSA